MTTLQKACIAAAAIGLAVADVTVPDLPASYSYQLHYQLNTTKIPFTQVCVTFNVASQFAQSDIVQSDIQCRGASQCCSIHFSHMIDSAVRLYLLHPPSLPLSLADGDSR